MPKDYANRSANTARRSAKRTTRSGGDRRHSPPGTARARSRKKSSRKRTGGFAWSTFGSGILLGALSTLVIALLLPGWTSDNSSSISPGDADSSGARATGGGIPVTRFEFYDLLRQDPGFTAQEPSSPKTSAPKQSDIEYLLQAGSFRQQEEAQRLRAQLILLGLDTNIVKLRAESGTLWHRVVVGPFSEKLLAQRATTKLRENGVDPLPLRRTRP